MSDTDRQLTTAEAGAALDPPVKAARIRQYILEGRLPAEKRGRDWLVRVSDLEKVGKRKPGRPSKPEQAD